jgi:hypothetical protein
VNQNQLSLYPPIIEFNFKAYLTPDKLSFPKQVVELTVKCLHCGQEEHFVKDLSDLIIHQNDKCLPNYNEALDIMLNLLVTEEDWAMPFLKISNNQLIHAFLCPNCIDEGIEKNYT